MAPIFSRSCPGITLTLSFWFIYVWCVNLFWDQLCAVGQSVKTQRPVPHTGPVISPQPWHAAHQNQENSIRGAWSTVGAIEWKRSCDSMSCVDQTVHLGIVSRGGKNKQTNKQMHKGRVWVLEARLDPGLSVHFSLQYESNLEICGSDGWTGWTAVLTPWIIGWTQWNQDQAGSM